MSRALGLKLLLASFFFLGCKQQNTSSNTASRTERQHSPSAAIQNDSRPQPVTIDTIWDLVSSYIESKKQQALDAGGTFDNYSFFCFDHAFLLYSQDFVEYARSRKIEIVPMFVLAFDAYSPTNFGHSGVIFKTIEPELGEKWWYSEHNKKVPFGPYMEGGTKSFWGFSDYVFKSVSFYAADEVEIYAKDIFKKFIRPLRTTASTKPYRRITPGHAADLKFKTNSKTY